MTLQTKPTNNIRVFISSTFNDMQAERDQLVKKTFPILRSHCEKAGLTFTEVDLRWGITNEEAADDKVLSICLQEIEQSRPYFIGILGDRYGWIPDSFPENLSASEPWLAHEKGKSVTELEILNGVLNNRDMAGYAFFYFRKEGKDAAKALDADKLLLLKERIRASGFPVKEGFTSPEELGLWIETDLKKVIEPQLVTLESMNSMELAEMEAKANLKTQSAFYVKALESTKKLDDFVLQQDDSSSVLLFEGESGMGKYSCLSNWYLQQKNQNHKFIFYPTRAGSNFTDVNFMLRFLTYSLLDSTATMPPDNANRYKLLEHFIAAMKHVAQTTPCTIIIPDVDQLSDAQQGRGLIWMPNKWPDGINIIVSASNPNIVQELHDMEVQQLVPQKLNQQEIEEFTKQFLNQYRKKLSASLIKSITASTLVAIPINLMIILEELRIFGNHEKLEETLLDYLTAANTKDLYLKVISRWESDYNDVYPDLVQTSLSCIFISVTGVSEVELRGMLSKNSLLPQAYWSPLYLAMSKWIVKVKGNLKIGNSAFKEAIIEKYLKNPENVIHAHQIIADYFIAKLQNTKPGHREFTELPYALYYSNNYNEFVNFYAKRENLKDAWKYSQSLVTQYFYLPEKYNKGHFTDIINKEIVDGDDYTRLQKEDVDYLITVAEIFQTMGYNEQAIMFWNMITGVGQQNNNDVQFELGLSKLAFLEMQAGNNDKAVNFYSHLLSHYEQKEDKDGIVSTYHNLGLCYQATGANEDALKYFKKAAIYFEEKKDFSKLLIALINCSNTLERLKKNDEAEEYLNYAETICKQLGDNINLAIIYDEKAVLHRNKNEYEKSLDLSDKAISLFNELNHMDKYVLSLASRGKTFLEVQHIEKGIKDYIISLNICMTRGMKHSKDEIVHMFEDAMKWNVVIWLGTGKKELVDEVFYKLDDFSEKNDGVYEEVCDEFYELMEKSIAFANAFHKKRREEE